MKIRGRRVALLLTGVLPLLAIDDVPLVEDNDNQYSADDARQKSQDAAEKMHDDALTSIPSLQLLDLSSSSYAANVVMVDDFFGDDYEFLDMKNATTTRTADERIDHATTTTEVVSKTNTEPVVTTLDVEVATSDEEGDEPVQESSTEETIEEEAAAFDEQSLEEEEQVPVEGAGSAQAETRGEENQEEIVSDETMEEIKEEIMEEIKEEEIKEEGKDQEEEEEEVVSEPVMVDYASKSAGALILESSPSMKGASNLLHSDKDKYAISPCTDKKYVVLGLSEDILVKQIKIANYERYSSHVKSFQIMGSQTMGQWVDLGVFEAGNLGNGEQAFNLMEPSWARYLKFKFNTHYGSEHYCTLSQVRVHGSTMQQGFHEEWKEAEEEKENAAAKAAAAEKAVETVDVSVAKTDGDEVETKAAPVVDLEKPIEATTTGEAPTDDATAETVDDSDDDTATEPAEVEVSPPEVVTVRKVTEQALGTEPAAKLSGLKLPRQLPPIFDIHTAPIPSALARARFESPAHKDMYRPPRIEALNTAAICPAPRRHDFNRVIRDATMKGVTNKTSDAQPQKIDYASTVSNAVRELQSRIQTTLGRTWELQHTIQTMIGKALPDLDEAWRQDAVVSEEGNTEQVTEPEETVNTKAETTPPPQAVAVEKTDSKPEAEIAMEERSATSIVEDTAVLDTEMPAGLAAAVARYPSANCLEALNFPAFKKNMMDKVATGNGATGNQPGKMEPVFKTLTLEIKALQISQNVHDQFSRALVTCYQNIMMEMANELHQTKTVQEDRLSNLETEMRQMKSNDWVAQIGSTVVYLMGIFLSLSAIFYTQAFLFIKDTVPVILAMEGGLYILGGLGFVSIIFILLLVRVLRRRPVSYKEQ